MVFLFFLERVYKKISMNIVNAIKFAKKKIKIYGIVGPNVDSF